MMRVYDESMWLRLLVLVFAATSSWAQILEYESSGIRYQAQTKNGLTIILGELPSSVRSYSVLQVAVSNGSTVAHSIRPEDFRFQRADGSELTGTPAITVVRALISKASRGDAMRLVSAYEAGVYGNSEFKVTNGYERRRQVAISEASTKMRAATTASAIALVQTKLAPGESTDGAVFFANAGKPLGQGTMRVNAAGATFEFPMLSSN